MSERVLLLIGSPGNMRSNSSMIGRYLTDRLAAAGWGVDKACIYQVVKDETKLSSVFDMMEESDLVVLSFPLYVDSLPSQLIRFLELANDQRKGTKRTGQRLMGVCQSGFPESHHNDYALRICSIFAKDAGFRWVGGLSVGGGGAIGGMDLLEAGIILRNLRSALDLTAEALIGGSDVPTKAKELTDQGIAAPWMYNLIADRRWKKAARDNSVDLKAKPHG